VQSKRTNLREKKIKDFMNVQKEERVEDSLKLLMRDEEGEIVEVLILIKGAGWKLIFS